MSQTAASAGASSRRGLVLRALGTLLSLALLVYLIYSQGWSEFRDVLQRLPWYAFAAAVVCIFCSRVCVTLRWQVLLQYARVRLRFGQAFRLMFMGNFASNFLPSTVGGDLVRMAGVVALGVDSGVSAASLVMDRLVGMAGMASLGPFGLVLVSRQAGGGAVTGLPALGFIGGFQKLPGLKWIGQKARRFVRGLVSSSVDWFHHPAGLLLALVYNYGHMLFTFLAIWLLLWGMKQPLSLLWIGALWSLSYFISLVPVSINGLGLQEVSITMLYSRFGGVSMEAALALAILIRLLFLLASLPGVLFLPDILRPAQKMPAPGPKENPSTSGEP